MPSRRRDRQSKRGSARLASWIVQHPVIMLTVVGAGGFGVLVDYLFHVSYNTQMYVSGSVPIVVVFLYWFGRIGYGAIYVIVALHPITGRWVCAYVGLTTQMPYRDRDGTLRYPRIEQHLLGSNYYGKGADPWADTVVKWWFAHESYHMLGVRKRPGERGEAGPVLRFLEFVHIRVRRPLYNYIHNGQNGRQIPRLVAESQRAERDSGIYTDKYYRAMQRHTPHIAQ